MSVKLGDLMKLPSLKEAKVVSGKSGLSKLVSSISVLEYTEVALLDDDLFDNNEFYGSEIVVSAFVNICNDVEAQCRTIERLHKVGEVALILYYVGIFIPKLDKKFVDYANELDFTIIVMPENEMSLRYSEVIYEVVEAIVKQEMTDTNFVSESLEQISNVRPAQRNIDTTLKILSDRTHVSLVLTDNSFQVINSITWPRTRQWNFDQIIETSKQLNENELAKWTVDERTIYTVRKPIFQDGMQAMHLFMMKEKDTLTSDIAMQISEVVQVFMNLWGKNYVEISTAELMKAILNDESLKMRRLGKILNVDVSSIKWMWLVKTEEIRDNEQVLAELKSFVASHFSVSLIDLFEKNIVVLLDNSVAQRDRTHTAQTFAEMMKQLGIKLKITVCQGMEQTSDVQRAYSLVNENKKAANTIYGRKLIYSLQEIEFAAKCVAIVGQGELSIAEHLLPLKPIAENEELIETLSVFLLEGESNYNQAAELLFLHKNTIKYRIQRINELLQYPVTKIPESYNLYIAVAVRRLLSETNNNN
ncbi:PucR family transcriptional regulator [Listeria seeligeri]|uniref:PucR family transcriptional regulator n=1 Tax=Listeria seeligeri TaxID=1640 RepID=UPI0016284632|nr:PucR family transcriptional regulator [Listeria seeligeri]MBC1442856.1 PucR family transcriptional regulator [Listeria seeligeri]MBC1772449.1 PucR family transcriptional regulator [Listeria seeligeri]